MAVGRIASRATAATATATATVVVVVVVVVVELFSPSAAIRVFVLSVLCPSVRQTPCCGLQPAAAAADSISLLAFVFVRKEAVSSP